MPCDDALGPVLIILIEPLNHSTLLGEHLDVIVRFFYRSGVV